MFCKYCGNSLAVGVQYCDRCGRSVIDGSLAPSAVAAAAVPVPGSMPAPQQFVLASSGQRFGNYIIDRIAALALSLTIVGALINMYPAQSSESDWMGLLVYVIYALYFIVCEALWQRTLGKVITRTKVVTRTGEHPTFGQIVGRSLARFIPFEPFSFFNKYPIGWHDQLSKTIVVPSSYTPADVKSMNIEEVRKQKGTNVGLVVAIVLLGFMFLGIFSAVILASLNTARQKALQQNGGTTVSLGDWKQYNSATEGFTATFPTFPTKTTQPYHIESINRTVTMNIYSSYDQGIAYIVNATGYPADIKFTDKNAALEGSVNGSAQNIEGGVIETTDFLTVDGYPAIDYEISGAKNLFITGRNVLVGNELYQIIVSYDTKDESKVQATRFIESFSILTSNSKSGAI